MELIRTGIQDTQKGSQPDQRPAAHSVKGKCRRQKDGQHRVFCHMGCLADIELHAADDLLLPGQAVFIKILYDRIRDKFTYRPAHAGGGFPIGPGHAEDQQHPEDGQSGHQEPLYLSAGHLAASSSLILALTLATDSSSGHMTYRGVSPME